MVKKIIGILMLLVAINISYATVYDDFDDGVLDSAWVVSYANTTDAGWVYSETGSKLVTTAINPTVAGVKWTDVQLGQVFTPVLNDLHIDFSHEWSQTEVVDMPYIFLSLKSSGALLATIGYEDKSTTDYGTPHVYTVSGSKLVDGGVSQSGIADWDINQINGQLIINLNGSNFLTVAESRPVDAIEIHVQGRYLGNIWTWQDSSPEFSIDLVRVIPEPATMSLLAIGAILLRRK